jgi:MoaA/NifB/PqqE/SkfB family radical SAM enzyme
MRVAKEMVQMWLREARRRVRPVVIAKIGFDIVHGCQLRCVGCPNSIIEPEIRFVTRETFRRCLGNLDVARIRAFRLFNFGEPLLHPDLAGLLEDMRPFRSKIEKIEISTNAQHPDASRLEAAFRTGMLSSLAVSCDGDGTAEDYERLRPPGKWLRLMKFLADAKRLRDAYAPGLTLLTRTICVSPEGQARWRQVLEPMGWSPRFRGWMDLPGSKRTESGANHPPPGRGVCPYLNEETYCYVDDDGTVVPCCVHPRAAVLGDLSEQPFSSILFGSARRQLIRDIVLRRNTLPVCGECIY